MLNKTAGAEPGRDGTKGEPQARPPLLPAFFDKPRYDRGGFASIPGRVAEALETQDTVILFLIDAFGWNFFERFADEDFLRRFAAVHPGEDSGDGTRRMRPSSEESGSGGFGVQRLLTQFPSTTSACLSTLHSGVPVGEHGVLEWNFYEESLDAIVSPLLFSYAGKFERDTLLKDNVSPASLLPEQSFYGTLAKTGVRSHIFQHSDYTPSTYSDHMFKGAEVHPYKTLAEVAANLSEMIPRLEGKNYILVYWDRIDSIAHKYGPDSPQTEAEILEFLLVMERLMLPRLSRSGKDLQVFLSADHGQTPTPPGETIYLNEDPLFSGLAGLLRNDSRGRPLVAAGSCRDFFLYFRDSEASEQAARILRAGLEGRAEIASVAQLAEAGYFGSSVSPRLFSRAGDLVVLPHSGRSVWWHEPGRFVQRLPGNHGGLCPEEMRIPFLSFKP